jgi:protein gp37
MSDNTAIEWTDATWNPVTGCTKVSPGCDNCYAERIVARFHGKGSFAVVARSEDKLYAPLRWRKPRKVFVNSMSDLFHDQVPLSFIERVFSVMARTPQHVYQLLTKRHGRMASILRRPTFPETIRSIVGADVEWPLPNLWLGVSVEDQKRADLRIPALLDTPASVRWLSCEPLLGPVDLARSLSLWNPGDDQPWHGARLPARDVLHWVVCGGESGSGARPMHPDWARSLRDQCQKGGIPFFFKQWGEWVPIDQMPADTFQRWDAAHGCDAYDWGQPWRVGKKAAGRELDDRTWDEYPGELVGGAA